MTGWNSLNERISGKASASSSSSALILWRRVPAMIGKMLDARAVAIQNELTQAKQLREEAEAVLVRYTERASHAQAEAQTILTQAKEEAERFAKESETQLKALIERRARRRRTASRAPKRSHGRDPRPGRRRRRRSRRQTSSPRDWTTRRRRRLIDAGIGDLAGKLN